MPPPTTKTLLFLVALVGLALFWQPPVAEASSILLRSDPNEKEFEIVPNPHQQQQQQHNDKGDASALVCSSGMGAPSLDAFLEPYYLLTQPMATQADTFQEIVYAKVLGVPVPTYVVKQPERLSPAQLGFQLVLVKDLSVFGKSQIRTAPVEDMAKARDSWFPGYYWTPLYYAAPPPSEGASCEPPNGNDPLHVGWKFTADDGGHPPSGSPPVFFALMIRMDPKSKRQEAAKQTLVGFRAPGWVRSQLRML